MVQFYATMNVKGRSDNSQKLSFTTLTKVPFLIYNQINLPAQQNMVLSQFLGFEILVKNCWNYVCITQLKPMKSLTNVNEQVV